MKDEGRAERGQDFEGKSSKFEIRNSKHWARSARAVWYVRLSAILAGALRDSAFFEFRISNFEFFMVTLPVESPGE